MSKKAPDSPEAFASRVRNTLLKGFAIPVAVLAFFASAPVWLNHNLHAQLARTIDQAYTLTATERAQRLARLAGVDFETLSKAPAPGLESLHQQLENSGIAGQFERLEWGLYLSVLLVAILVGVTLTTFLLNRRALESREQLIRSYRRAWSLSTAGAIAKTLLLIPLLAYGSFELTTLAAGQYFPRLILVVVIGGCVALWRSFKILFKPVPLEFKLRLARPVSPEEAPELWSDVREAAAAVGTAPPDNILIGMEQNFFVTELAVVHRGGRSVGRTLYLSYPLIRQLAPDEVMSIVGHELGHFRGDDTRITREFYPMRLRAQATINAMAGSGWVGWTSVHSLLFFHWSFARTEGIMSRQRELEADRIASKLTSPGTMGRALVKTHVFTEAFRLALIRRKGNPFEVPMAACVQEELVPNGAYWAQLFDRATAHPLDSHPPLRVRLEALGQAVTPEAAKAVSTVETDSAYGRWFKGRDALFSGVMEEALNEVGRMRTSKADYATEEGRQILDQNFPEVTWPVRKLGLWAKLAFCGLGFAVCALLVGVATDGVARAVAAAVAVLAATLGVSQWRRHHGGVFVLRADSINYSGWRRPLMFADIERISAKSSYGAITLIFRMRSKEVTIWKYSLFARIRTRSVALPVGLIAAPQKLALQTIDRYIARRA